MLNSSFVDRSSEKSSLNDNLLIDNRNVSNDILHVIAPSSFKKDQLSLLFPNLDIVKNVIENISGLQIKNIHVLWEREKKLDEKGLPRGQSNVYLCVFENGEKQLFKIWHPYMDKNILYSYHTLQTKLSSYKSLLPLPISHYSASSMSISDIVNIEILALNQNFLLGNNCVITNPEYVSGNTLEDFIYFGLIDDYEANLICKDIASLLYKKYNLKTDFKDLNILLINPANIKILNTNPTTFLITDIFSSISLGVDVNKSLINM